MDFRAGRNADGSRDTSTIGQVESAPVIRLGDMVVFFEGREAIGFDRMEDKGIWQCRHGAFHHGDMLGKPFGSRVFSRTTKGFVHALSPTPELWSHVVPNRTQIVQDFDQSIVIFRLNLKPGDVVVESGTGSGVMSSSIMRTIAPTGFLHTFEFNEVRSTRAREEFAENGLGDLARVVHRDVCAERGDGGGFGEDLDGKADAVFLDLPEPWLAVSHARVALKAGKTLCSYSPCIEQVMKTCEALRLEGFHSITTIEFRLRSINHTEVKLEVPDFGCSPVPATPAPENDPLAKTSPSSVPPPAPAHSNVSASSPETGLAEMGGGSPKNGKNGVPVAEVGSRLDAAVIPDVDIEREGPVQKAKAPVESIEVEATPEQTEKRETVEQGVDSSKSNGGASSEEATETDNLKQKSDGTFNSGEGGTENVGDNVSGSAAKALSNKRSREEPISTDRARREAESADAGDYGVDNYRKKSPPKAAGIDPTKPPAQLVCAQPYPIMRGHTAFLTFATTPVVRQEQKSDAGGATAGASSDGAQRCNSSTVLGDTESSIDGGPGDKDRGGASEEKAASKEEAPKKRIVSTSEKAEKAGVGNGEPAREEKNGVENTL